MFQINNLFNKGFFWDNFYFEMQLTTNILRQLNKPNQM